MEINPNLLLDFSNPVKKAEQKQFTIIAKK